MNNGYLGKEKSSIQSNGFSNYQTFGRKISRPERLQITKPNWSHRSPKKMESFERRKLESFERRKQVADAMAVAFDITPLDSPSGDSWADALTPHQTLDD